MDKPAQEEILTQVVDTGAVIDLTQEVLEHGILLNHPEMPLIKLFLTVGKKDGRTIIDKYHFEMIKPDSPEVKCFAVNLVRATEKKTSIIMPDQKIVT